MTVTQASGRNKPRGPYAKSEAIRKAILNSALEVFAESGYRSGSLRGVAERAGMSDTALLHHFGSKSALLAAVLARRDEQTRERLDLDPAGGIELLRSTIRLVEMNAATPGVVELFCVLSAEATSPAHPAHSYFVQRYDSTVTMIRTAFESMQARGELREGVRPAVAARATVALMDGLQVQWLLDRESVDMAADLREHFSFLVVGVL